MSTSSSKPAKAQGLVEYALAMLLVAVVVIAAVIFLGPIVGNVFSDTNNSLSGTGSMIPVSGDLETPSVDPTPLPTAAPIPSGSHVRASDGVCPPNSHRYHRHWWSNTYWCIQN